MSEILVEVIYPDGSSGQVTNDVLDVLIATGKITRFRRQEGWVDLADGEPVLRDYHLALEREEGERRSPWPDQRS